VLGGVWLCVVAADICQFVSMSSQTHPPRVEEIYKSAMDGLSTDQQERVDLPARTLRCNAPAPDRALIDI